MKKMLFLLLLIPVSLFAQPKMNYKNLVLEGGGVRGLAYPGALQVLEEKGILKNIENVASPASWWLWIILHMRLTLCFIPLKYRNLMMAGFLSGRLKE